MSARERIASTLIKGRYTVGWQLTVTQTLADLLGEWEHQPNPDTAIQIVHELLDIIQPTAEMHAAKLTALLLQREKQRRIA